jgi:hypothetical protein
MRLFLMMTAVAVSVGGCASVTRGWDEQIHFASNPGEALVRTSTGMSCTTPCSLKVGRKDEFNASFSKPGYITEDVFVKSQLAGGGVAGVAGNIVLGGVIGAGVDVASGAALDHCPNPVTLTLRPVGSKAPANDLAAKCNVTQPEPESKDKT